MGTASRYQVRLLADFPKPSKRYYILAGDYTQVVRYSLEAGLSNVKYIKGPETLHGLHGDDLVFLRVGTWDHRKDLAEIEKVMVANGLKWSSIDAS